ncbi:MAG: hypothetical protein V1752_01085, partial [Candidatus Firestonebacteria bacterium]
MGNQVRGVFVKEFAKAVAVQKDSFVISIHQEPGRKEKASFELKEEEGLRILYINGKGSKLRLLNRLYNLVYYLKGLLKLEEKGYGINLSYV